MTVAGRPAWGRVNTSATYGGHQQLRDFAGEGPVNPETDVSAGEYKRLAADVAAMQRVAPLADFRILCRDTPSALAPLVRYARIQSGVSLVEYNGGTPPPGFPAFTRLGNGSVEVTFPEQLYDEFGIGLAPEIGSVFASVVASVAGSYQVPWVLVNSRTFRVYARNAGALLADAELSLLVF